MKKGLVVVGVVLLVLVLLVGGVYFMLNGNKEVDVTWTEADFQSYLTKGGVNFNEDRASVEDLVAGNFATVGVVDVDDHFTNAEITAILNKAAKDSSFLTDMRVKFRDDGRVEASAKIGDNLEMVYQRFPEARNYQTYLNTFKGKSVYIVGTLERVDTNEFEAWTERAYVGHIPLPVGQTNNYLERVGTEINSILARLDGFSAEEFSFDSSGVYFKGQAPQEIKGTPWD